MKASLLFRLHNSEGVPVAEAGVNATTVPATRFVTFAEQGEGQFGTGVAYANPSDTSALVTFTAKDAAGQMLASVDRTLLPAGHGAHNMARLFDLPSFTGSLEVTSTEPIVSLSLNNEAAPVFSSLPPGEVDASATAKDADGEVLASLLPAAFEGQVSGLFTVGDSVRPGHGRGGALGANPAVGQRAVRMVSASVLFILALLKEESS